MILTRLRAKNFGVYYPGIDLKFPEQKGKNLWIFEGLTGTGKTTLFLAIIWALYGEDGLEFHTRLRAGGPKTTVDVISHEALRNGDSHLFVELHFKNGDTSYILQRYITPKKPVVVYPSDYEENVRLKDIRGKQIDLENEHIKEMLPLEASQFFFFAGEVLQKYAEPTSVETKNAIERVLGFPEIHDAAKDVKFYSKELSANIRESESSSEELRNLTKQIEYLDGSIETITARLKERKSKLEEITSRIPELQAKLKGFEEVQQLQARAEKLEQNKEFLLDEEEKLKEQRYERIRRLPFMVARKQLRGSFDKFKERIDLASAEAGIRRTEPVVHSLETLLRTDRCWCGNPIEDFERKNLQHTYDIYKKELDGFVEKARNKTIPSISEISAAIGYLDGLDADYERIDNELKKIRVQIGDIDTETDKIDKHIRGAPIQEVRITKELLDKDIEGKGGLVIQIQEDQNELERDNRARDEHRREIATMQIQSKAVDAWRSKLTEANKAMDALEFVSERLRKGKKKVIEDSASRSLKAIATREITWDRVSITDDYTVELLDQKDNMIPRVKLSDGQKEILALSFMSGLKSATERSAPVVIDWLLGRLDLAYQDNVAEQISSFGEQVFYFTLDSELTPQRRKALERQACEWFTIKKDARTGASEVCGKGE